MSDQTNTDTIPPAPAPEVRRLKRRLDHKVVAGVAAGLGEYFDIDPVLFRVGFVLLTVLGGAGILIYLAAWWLMPPDDAPAVGHPGNWHDHRGERVMRRLKGSPGWVGVGLLVIGGALLANDLGVRRPAVTWGVALIVLGVLMFRRGTDAATHEEVERAHGAAAYGPTSPGGTLPTPPSGLEPPRTPRRRRERSSLGWFTLGALMLALGAAALLDTTNVVALSGGQYLALSLAVLGAGLAIGAWWGRARWLVVPGLLLIPLVLGASLLRVPFQGGVGQRVFRPNAVVDVRHVYRLGAGQLTVDLTQVPFAGERIGLPASVAMGQLVVVVPPGLSVQIHAAADAGEVDLFGQRYDGLKTSVDRTFVSDASPGTLVLDLRAGFGQVTLSRSGSDGSIGL